MCFCGVCDRRLVAYPAYRGGEYRCCDSINDGTTGACGRTPAVAEELEDKVSWSRVKISFPMEPTLFDCEEWRPGRALLFYATGD
jgi:hypothetical protein